MGLSRDRVLGEQVGRVKQGQHFGVTLKLCPVSSQVVVTVRMALTNCPFDKINGTENLSSLILSCLLSRNKPRNALRWPV